MVFKLILKNFSEEHHNNNDGISVTGAYLWSVSMVRMSLYNELAVIFLMSIFTAIPSRGPASYNKFNRTIAIVATLVM